MSSCTGSDHSPAASRRCEKKALPRHTQSCTHGHRIRISRPMYICIREDAVEPYTCHITGLSSIIGLSSLFYQTHLSLSRRRHMSSRAMHRQAAFLPRRRRASGDRMDSEAS